MSANLLLAMNLILIVKLLQKKNLKIFYNLIMKKLNIFVMYNEDYHTFKNNNYSIIQMQASTY